jgi:preprotein translocase subunit SecF
MRILTNVNIDWLRWRWYALALSWVVILTGVTLILTRGLPLGIDFSGGTLVIVEFEQPVDEESVRRALDPIPGDKGVQKYGASDENQILIRLPQSEDAEQGFNLEQGARQVVDLLTKANLGKFEVLSMEVVGPVIGADLQRKGIYATIAAMLGIMAYIAFRFRLSFGIGAMIASLHDVLITLSLLTIFGYELSLNVVAAILTLVGYGVNDQIVIFDRVRENLRTHRREPLESVINRSVNQTLPRTIITAGTTFLSVLALFLFGGEVLAGFAFAMLVGIVTSTYSTVFIASAIAVMLSKRGSHGRAAPATAAVPAPTSEAGVSARRKARKARAS